MMIESKVLIDQLYTELRRAEERARGAELFEDHDAVCSEVGFAAGIQRAISLIERFAPACDIND